MVARPDAHCARLRRGPGLRARRRRRRLPDEAVLVRRAACAAPGACAPARGRASDGARGRRPAPRSCDAQAWRGETEIGSPPRSSAARGVHAAAGPGALPPPPARALLGLRLREPLERRRRLRPLPPREGRPPFGRKSLETVRGSGYRLRTEEPRADPSPVDVAFALAMAVVLAAPASSSTSGSRRRSTKGSRRR